MISLLINIIKSIKCKFKGHELVNAGSCPYTGLTYKACLQCGKITPVDKSE